jgi:uncharacterized delta-60 repeat protein
MKAIPTLPLVLLLSLFLASTAFATDYRPDTSYPDLGFTSTDVIYDVYVHPDGRYLVAGEDFTGNSSVPFLKRYFANGTLDTSFVSAIQPASGPSQNYVTDIVKVYPNGQYLLRGRFNAPSFGYWARINPNGSLDSTVPAGAVNAHVRAAQDDGKLLFCGPITQNGTTYQILYRRNADLSFDPTFRVSFTDPYNGCPEGLAQPDGRILVAGEFSTGGQNLRRLYRLNNDGSVDQTFNPNVTTTLGVHILMLLADGKILIRDFDTLKLLNPDGTLAVSWPTCGSSFAVQLADGSFLANGCRKSTAANARYFPWLRIKTDGTVDQSMDYNDISGFEGVRGFREDGNGGFYIYGGVALMDGFNRRGLIHAVPNTTPKKARFDFDGDGKSDVAVFRPSDGFWYLNQSTAGYGYVQWGFSTDRPAAGDANQDGKTDVAVFRNGAWHALTSGSAVHYYMCLGTSGDLPLVGSNSEFGVTRDMFASRGTRSGSINWFVRGGYVNCWMSNQQPSPNLVAGETAADKPVVGDFNGDSLDEIGYFRDGYWYGVDTANAAAPTSFQWGSAGDIPVPGDYDGDRQTDYAIFRPSTGEWWVNRSSLGAFVVRFGLNGDIPVPADYDGDGKSDIAIYRNGAWWQLMMGTGAVQVVNWGLAGDIPIPAQSQF